MLYPRRNTAVGFIVAKFIGGAPASASYGSVINRRGIFTAFPKTTAVPDGYSAGGAVVMPYLAGGMSSWQSIFGIDGVGNAIAGGPMDGSGSISVSGDGSLSLTVSLSGDGTVTITGDLGIALTISLSGDAGIAIAGLGSMSLIVPIFGVGAFGITGSADLRGNMGMSGSWGGSEPLSPQGLASAVWSALASQNNNPGTMGDLLNSAGGGGISGAVIDQIADAVWLWANTVTPGSKGDELAKALRAAKLAAALAA